MPKYIKHYIQQKNINKFNEKRNRKILMLYYLKKKYNKKKRKKLNLILTFARIKSRCILNGRAKGYYGQFKLSRHSIKKIFGLGQIPGLIISSW